MLTNLMSLWNFVCAPEFTKAVNENVQCFETAENDINIQRCLVDAMEDFDTNIGNTTVSIAQHREHRCSLAKKQLNCFTEFNFLKKCQSAIELQHRLLSFIVNNVSDLSSCEIPTFAAIIDKFEVAERGIHNFCHRFWNLKKPIAELSRGGCNANGECSCVPGFKFDNSTRKCIGKYWHSKECNWRYLQAPKLFFKKGSQSFFIQIFEGDYLLSFDFLFC